MRKMEARSAMNYDELITTLIDQQALIVHCSRPGKADEISDPLLRDPRPLYPDDLINAIQLINQKKPGLSCSVVWPAHQETFGHVGIAVRPRSKCSITEISKIDGGSDINETTGMLEGGGNPLSRDSMLDTFRDARSYNEWIVADAEPIGIFVTLGFPLFVSKLVKAEDIPGYEPSLIDIGETIGIEETNVVEIYQAFPKLPVFGYSGNMIVKINRDRCLESVNLEDLYSPEP